MFKYFTFQNLRATGLATRNTNRALLTVTSTTNHRVYFECTHSR